jgi:hypothetical protein
VSCCGIAFGCMLLVRCVFPIIVAAPPPRVSKHQSSSGEHLVAFIFDDVDDKKDGVIQMHH